MTTRKIWKQKGILWGCITSLLVLGNTDAEARRKRKNNTNTQNTQVPANTSNKTPNYNAQQQGPGFGWCRKTAEMLNHRESGASEDFNFVPVNVQLRDPQTAANEQFLQAVQQRLTADAQPIFTKIWNLVPNADQYSEPVCRTLRNYLVLQLNQEVVTQGEAYDHNLVPPANWPSIANWCNFVATDGMKGLKKDLKDAADYIAKNLYVIDALNNKPSSEVNEQTEFLLSLLLQRLDDMVLRYDYPVLKANVDSVVQTLTSTPVNWTISNDEVRLFSILANYSSGQINSFLAQRQLRNLIDSGAFDSSLSDWLTWGARLIVAPFPEAQSLGQTLLVTLLASMKPAVEALRNRTVAAPSVLPGLQAVLQLSPTVNNAAPMLPAAPSSNLADLSGLLQQKQNILNQNVLSPGATNGQVLTLGGSAKATTYPSSASPSFNLAPNQYQQLTMPVYGPLPQLQGLPLPQQNQSQKSQPQQKEKSGGISLDLNGLLNKSLDLIASSRSAVAR